MPDGRALQRHTGRIRIKGLSVIIQGNRILAIEGNTFFLADMVRREITAMIDGKFPIFDERKQDK